MKEKIKVFAELLERDQRERYLRQYPNSPAGLTDSVCRVTVKPGKKYIKIDVGTTGKYMVDQSGAIWGIKGYGVIHKGHQYGTLDTIGAWNWSEYYATNVTPVSSN